MKEDKKSMNKFFKNSNIFYKVLNFFKSSYGKIILYLSFIIFLVVLLTSLYHTLGKNSIELKTKVVAKKEIEKESCDIRTYSFSIDKNEAITSDFIMHKLNNKMPRIVTDYIAEVVHREAPKYGLDVSFVIAKIFAESSFKPDIVNKDSGAKGLMQILSKGVGWNETSETYKIEFDQDTLFNIEENIVAGLLILKEKMDEVREDNKGKSSYARRNLMSEAMTRYVGASSKKGKAIARNYRETIFRVQGEYVMFRALYLSDNIE